MPDHYWGDDWPYWEDLHEAIQYLTRLARHRYRLPFHDIKEKYGTLRGYVGCLGWTDLHAITHPGYCSIRLKGPFRWLNYNLCCCKNPFWKWLVWWPSYRVQKYLYRRAYAKTVARWPHLAPELLSMAEGRELLKGIVDPATCGHESVWESMHDGTRTCGVCMTEL